MKRSTFNNVKTVINAVFGYGINNDIPCIKANQISTKRLKFAPLDDKWASVYSPKDKKKILVVCAMGVIEWLYENYGDSVWLYLTEVAMRQFSRTGSTRT